MWRCGTEACCANPFEGSDPVVCPKCGYAYERSTGHWILSREDPQSFTRALQPLIVELPIPEAGGPRRALYCS